MNLQQTIVHIGCWPELCFSFKMDFQKLKAIDLRFIQLQVKQLVIQWWASSLSIVLVAEITDLNSNTLIEKWTASLGLKQQL